MESFLPSLSSSCKTLSKFIRSLYTAKPFTRFQLGKYFLLKIYLYENLTGVDPRLLNTIILNYRRAFTYMACTWMVLDGNVEAVN